MPKKAEEKIRACRFCAKTLTNDDQFCYGCKAYICEKCDVNWNPPMGIHSPSVHLEEPDD